MAFFVLQFPGCKEACQFHVESEGGQRVPVIQTRGEGVIRVSGGVASWPRPARPHGPFVYVLMRRLGDRPWRQISQGLSTSARVPDGGVLRVLVVDRNGLVTIYSPGSKSGLEEARGVLESMGRTDLLAPLPPPSQGKRINTEIALPTTSIPTGILVSLNIPLNIVDIVSKSVWAPKIYLVACPLDSKINLLVECEWWPSLRSVAWETVDFYLVIS